jgi:hypothetical protein
MATKNPDENERARGKGPPLPDDPFKDTEPMPDPDAEAAAKAKAKRLDALKATRVGAFLDRSILRMEARASGAEMPVPVPCRAWPKRSAVACGPAASRW